MIRRLTLVCMCAFAASGLHLYRAKAAAEMETRDIRRIQTDAEATRQRAEVLKNEYQLENNPERLRDLSGKFKQDLTETTPAQFTTLVDFERRLPAVGLPAPAQPPAATPEAVVYDQPPAPKSISAEPAREDKAALVASAKPSSDAPAAHAAPKPAPRPIKDALARAPTSQASGAMQSAAISQSQTGAQTQTVSAYSPASIWQPAGANPSSSLGDRGSALGSSYRVAPVPQPNQQPNQQPKLAAATSGPAYSPQRPYAQPQYAAGQYSQQYAPRPYAPSPNPSYGSGGGSSLGMAHALAPVSYQSGFPANIGNGG